MPDGTPLAPTPPASRHDGWTVEKQRRFLLTLADTGCVTEAAREAGMSARSAYRLRRRIGAADFSDAWDRAMVVASRRLTAEAYERALNGTPQEVWHKGEFVGTRFKHNDRLLMFLLAHADPLRFGRLATLQHAEIRDPRQNAESDMFHYMHQLRDGAATEPLVPGQEDDPA